MATKSTVHARSAMPSRQKKTFLTQELLTVMKNCSPHLDPQWRTKLMNHFMMRMQFSGYNKEFRFVSFRFVLNSAKKAHEKQLELKMEEYHKTDHENSKEEDEKKKSK